MSDAAFWQRLVGMALILIASWLIPDPVPWHFIFNTRVLALLLAAIAGALIMAAEQSS